MKGVLLFLCLVVLSYGQIPGIKSTLSQKGLNYFEMVGIQFIESTLGTISIPNVSEQDGYFILNLTNIALDKLVIGPSSASFVPGQGISLTSNGTTGHLSLDWYFGETVWPYIDATGSADIYASAITASLSTVITTSSSGVPQAAVTADYVNVGNLNIELHGGDSTFYQIIVNMISGIIQNVLSSALQAEITEGIDVGVNQIFSTLPLVTQIGGGVEVDFKLLGNPQFNPTYMTIPALGEFYQVSNPQECPNTICERYKTDDIITDQMLQFIITDFVANSAGYTYYDMGELSVTIQNSDVPSSSPIKLNTSSFEDLIPNLYKLYPNDLLEVKLYCTQSPQIVFSPGTAVVTAIGNLEMWVIQSNGQLAPAFTLSGSIHSIGSASLNGQLLIGNLTYLQGNFTLEKTEIGPFNEEIFGDLLNLFFNSGVIPSVNNYLKKGFPLPILPGLTLINPSLGFGDRYAYVSADVTYNPPQHAEKLHRIQLN